MKKNLMIVLSVGILILFSVFFSTSCSKDSNGGDTAKDSLPKVYSIDPVAAKEGDTLTILGKNFSPVTTENKVIFNSVQLTIIAASDNELVVVVPNGSGDAPIVVSVNGVQANFHPVFSYFRLPINLYPPAGGPGTQLVVYCRNIDFDTTENVVYFGELTGEITGTQNSSLFVTVPEISGVAQITLMVDGTESEDHPQFQYNLMSCDDISHLSVSNITFSDIDYANDDMKVSFDMTNTGEVPLILGTSYLTYFGSGNNVYGDSDDKQNIAINLGYFGQLLYPNQVLTFTILITAIDNYLILRFDLRDYKRGFCNLSDEYTFIVEVPQSE